jgi:signal transduction histidine kinase
LPAESDFRKVIGTDTSGALARFLENKLHLMVWYRPPNAGSLVFGAQITQQELILSLTPLLLSPDLHRGIDAAGSSSAKSAYCLALLDDRGKPVALSRSGFTADWKHPLVATEIGETLPHWEAALYLLDPQQINRSASTLQLTLGFVVLTLVAAILLGGWLMAADVRRQMTLAQQKTDFVGNVSHELKTPLTSIRMFADMLADGRVTEPDRQSKYLRIISAESARLTRLINNVLDFARLEQGVPSAERAVCDLIAVVQEVVDTCRPHLETVGVPLALEINAQTALWETATPWRRLSSIFSPTRKNTETTRFWSGCGKRRVHPVSSGASTCWIAAQVFRPSNVRRSSSHSGVCMIR